MSEAKKESQIVESHLDQVSKGKLRAMDENFAVIEFEPDGTIVTANDNFLKATGYEIGDIKGGHHSMFCPDELTSTLSYKAFWRDLGNGQAQSGEFLRKTSQGEDLWIQASYTCLFDEKGKVFRVVKFASDITEQKRMFAEYEGKIKAIETSQAVIEFTTEGSIITANKNFLATTGYSLEEIKGQHHRMFCEDDFKNSPQYGELWAKLKRGEFDAGEYKRLGKGGKPVYIQASYNPIFNAKGEVIKVVKFASDLTKEKEAYNDLVNSFEQASDNLSQSASKLAAAATQMSDNAQRTLESSQSASASAEQVSQGVKTVGTNTEEMSASIREIANSSASASRMSNEAKEKSSIANRTVSELGVASEEIGAVIKVISSIAQQTNLLALNATIEAARAGEAGKGFAVVAKEVKELALKTAAATDEISQKILNIQSSTESAVTEIQDIGSVIDSLNDIATSTAAAVEEQASTTNEVSRVVMESSQGVGHIAEVIKLVSGSAEESSTGAKRTLEEAESLTSLSERLKVMVKEAKRN